MKFLFMVFVLANFASCNKSDVNKSDEIVRNQELMDKLNDGDTSAIQAELSDPQNDSEKIILASSLATDAGVDIYGLLPLIKDRFLTAPLIERPKNESLSQITKRMTKNLEFKVKINLSRKNVDDFLATLSQVIAEVEKNGDEDSPSLVRAKAILTAIDPSLSKILQLKHEELIDQLYRMQHDIIQQVRDAQNDHGDIKYEVNIGKINKEMFGVITGIIELVSISKNTPELTEEGYKKIDEAVSILNQVDIKNTKIYIKAQKHIALLISIAIINNARSIFRIHGELQDILCQDSDANLKKFMDETSKYFDQLYLTSTKINEVNPNGLFIRLAKDLKKLTNQTKEERNKVFESVNRFIEKESKKYCE